MTACQSIFPLGLLAILAVPQVVDLEKWNMVERMCGKLEWVENIPVKGTVSEFKEKSRPLKNSEIRLYRREGESSCCGTGLPIARVVTNKSGDFDFKHAVPGRYWITVEVDGKPYGRAIKYVSSKDEVSCADLLYDIDKGELDLKRIITVD